MKNKILKQPTLASHGIMINFHGIDQPMFVSNALLQVIRMCSKKVGDINYTDDRVILSLMDVKNKILQNP